METAAAVRVPVSARSDVFAAAALAAVSSVLVAVLAPPGGDAAAHLYRTELLREGHVLWDNLWFAGHYPLASYSLLYYVPAALVGNVLLVVAATIVSSALFASIAAAEWGAAARWPIRLFAVLAAGPLYTGTYSYAAGLAAALGAVRLAQTGRVGSAVGCAGLALGFSPLAFVFACLALAATAIARGRVDRPVVLAGAGLAALAGLKLGLLVVFPSEGRYPYSPVSLMAVLAVSGLGAALAARAERARPLAAFFALWGVLNLVAFAVPSPFGDNLTRPRTLVLALVLLAAVLARFQPRWLAAAALAVAAVFNLGPDLSALPKRIEDAHTAEAAFWQPAIDFVSPRTQGYRVEVVPTFGHWEAYRLPRAGVPIARGWYRQLDMAQNPELYRRPLEPAAYRAWLRRLGVRFVLLPQARLGPLGAGREAALLRSDRSGLRTVFRDADWTIYELPKATPILTGPAAVSLERLGHERVAGNVAAPGTYRLRVRWTRHRRVTGPVCLEREADGMTRVIARRAGRFELAPALAGGGGGC